MKNPTSLRLPARQKSANHIYIQLSTNSLADGMGVAHPVESEVNALRHSNLVVVPVHKCQGIQS
jgi:hypothetical protein